MVPGGTLADTVAQGHEITGDVLLTTAADSAMLLLPAAGAAKAAGFVRVGKTLAYTAATIEFAQSGKQIYEGFEALSDGDPWGALQISLALAQILFAKGDRHLSAEELHEEALAAGVPVSLATVYNSLHQFTEAGLLRILAVEGSRTYFDTNTSDHHHFFVEGENRIFDIGPVAVGVVNVPEPPEGMEIVNGGYRAINSDIEDGKEVRVDKKARADIRRDEKED